MAEFQTIQSSIIDTLLQRNPYMNKLSVADRIAVYNEALKQLATVRNYIYDNVTQTGNQVAINMDYLKLSNLQSIDDIMVDNFIELSTEERLLLYNITQFRIASLRILQKQSHYAISNIRNLYISSIKNVVLPIASNIVEITNSFLQEKILSLPIAKSIIDATIHTKEKTLSLPILKNITDILGQTKTTFINLPILKNISLINIQTFTKYLSLQLSHQIISSDPIESIITLSLQNLNIGSEAGSTSIFINSNVAWSVSSNQSWLTVNGNGTIGNSNISLSWTANANMAQRLASITITGDSVSKAIYVIQAQAILTTEEKWINQLKNLLLPIQKNIAVVASYQHIKERTLALPITKSIEIIG